MSGTAGLKQTEGENVKGAR